MSATRAIVCTFQVAGFTAEVSIPQLERGAAASVVVEWSPRVPDFEKDFTETQRSEYRLRLIGTINEVQR